MRVEKLSLLHICFATSARGDFLIYPYRIYIRLGYYINIKLKLLLGAILVQDIIVNLLSLNRIKHKSELSARILHITPTALNHIIQRNSVGTLLNHCFNNNIPLDAITRAENEVQLEIYHNCFKLAQLALKDEELASTLATLVASKNEKLETKKIIEEIFEKFLAQTALEKIVEYFGARKERGLRVLYFFLLHLQDNPIPLDNIPRVKSIFIERIREFELEVRHKALFLFTIRQSDKDNLIQFLDQNLDEVAVLEICLNATKALKIIKEKMTLFDRTILAVGEA